MIASAKIDRLKEVSLNYLMDSLTRRLILFSKAMGRIEKDHLPTMIQEPALINDKIYVYNELKVLCSNQIDISDLCNDSPKRTQGQVVTMKMWISLNKHKLLSWALSWYNYFNYIPTKVSKIEKFNFLPTADNSTSNWYFPQKSPILEVKKKPIYILPIMCLQFIQLPE